MQSETTLRCFKNQKEFRLKGFEMGSSIQNLVQLYFGISLVPRLHKEGKTQCYALTLTNTITQEENAQNIQH